MRQCAVCGAYTLEESHCGRKAVPAHPAPFNPSDPYGTYRRAAKEAGGKS